MSAPKETFTITQFLVSISSFRVFDYVELTKAKPFKIIVWLLSGVALAFLSARLVIRLKVYGRLMVDDGLVILAMICLLTNDIVYTMARSSIYVIQSVQFDHHPKPSHYQQVADTYAKYQWANAYLFFTVIWAVKGSFLAYYDDLTKRLTPFRRAWWATVAFTTLTYIGSLFAYAFLDGLHIKTNLRNEAIKYQFAADLSTDVFSMCSLCACDLVQLRLTIRREVTIIPLTLALKVQIPARQKLALAGVFSLGLIVTVFSVIRFALTSPARGTVGPSWIGGWSSIEQSVSVIVACLASFRVLAIDRRRKSASDRAKNKASSSNERSGRSGLSDLRPHWGSSSREPKDNGSMELQLLDAPTSKIQTHTIVAGSGKNAESGGII